MPEPERFDPKLSLANLRSNILPRTRLAPDYSPEAGYQSRPYLMEIAPRNIDCLHPASRRTAAYEEAKNSPPAFRARPPGTIRPSRDKYKEYWTAIRPGSRPGSKSLTLVYL